MGVFTEENVLPWGQTCCTSFPVYQVDFGFGSPYFSPGLNMVLAWEMFGMSFVGPPTPGVSSSAAFMAIRATPQVLAALENQPDFLPFFLPLK